MRRGHYQAHDISDAALNIQDVQALNMKHTAIGSDGWKVNERGVSFHNGLDLVQSFKQEMIHFGGGDANFLDEGFGVEGQILKLLFRLVDFFAVGASDDDLIRGSTFSTWRIELVNQREYWGEVYGSVRGGLDSLDLLSSAAANERMQ